MPWSLAFQPLLPLWALILIALLGAGVLALRAFTARRGVILRMLAYAMLLALLANPIILREIRKPEPDIAVIVTDNSESEDINDRAKIAVRARTALQQALSKEPNLQTRVLTLGRTDDGTEIFGPLAEQIADIPASQLAGIVLITDGVVHDVPTDIKALAHDAPVHALLTGRPDEADRKLTVLRAPVFGIVGEPVSITLRVDDEGVPQGQAPADAQITISVDGKRLETRTIPTAHEETLPVTLSHGGHNIIEIETDPGPKELTLINNRAVVTPNGVRDLLRVLLVTGEPHAGERTWRDLLKADPSVDLVHFTILRPPEKQDGTPIDELSLIAFPTRDLFEEKLDDFNLIIFDRYRRRGVLPIAYLSNVAAYVERGGALLDAAGPSFASALSLYRTPLAAVLPAQPTGDVIEEPFRVRVTDAGQRHPVTAGLDGANTPGSNTEPKWGRWFRLLDTSPVSGETLLAGPNGRPALVLDHVQQGRVAQLLTDQSWLWARGYDGGGPQAELLRRLAHWLMKEPDLEEEVLSADVVKQNLVITRRTMADHVAPVTVTKPDGSTEAVTLAPTKAGEWRAEMPVSAQGLYHLDDGTLTGLAAVGPLNPREYADLRADASRLKPVTAATGGGVLWLTQLSGDAPSVRRVSPGRVARGRDWIGLRANNAFAVTGLSQFPLLPAPLALLLAGGFLALAWYRESR